MAERLNQCPQNIYDFQPFFDGYESLRQSGRGLNEMTEHPAMWSMLPDSISGLRVLDLGCGFGDLSRKLRTAGARSVIGIDLSARMLAKAAERTRESGIEYCRGHIEQMAFAENSFDLVVSSLALHYVKNYADVLARVSSVLVEGGRFAFSVEHPMVTAMAGQQWVRDAAGKPLHWPIDNYRAEGVRYTNWFVEGVVKFHRTIETYVRGLLTAGFTLRALLEPEPVEAAEPAEIPELDLHRRRPPYLLIAADRTGGPPRP